MKKVYLTAKPRRGVDGDKATEEALEALSHTDLIDTAEASFGLFGRLRRRDFKEREEDKVA